MNEGHQGSRFKSIEAVERRRYRLHALVGSERARLCFRPFARPQRTKLGRVPAEICEPVIALGSIVDDDSGLSVVVIALWANYDLGHAGAFE